MYINKINNKFYDIFIVALIAIIITLINYFLIIENASNTIFFNFSKNQANLFLILISFLTPASIIIAKLFFLLFVIYIYKGCKNIPFTKILIIASISYIPILMGSYLNSLLNKVIGYKEYGYFSIFSYFQFNSNILNDILKIFNPFELLSVLLLNFLYLKFSKSNKEYFITLTIIYFIFNILLSLLFGAKR